MPVDSRIFNTRVTSKFLEKRFRSQFPAQAGAELIEDLYASGVIQPVVQVNADLPEYLQGAWDPSTYQHRVITNSVSTLLTDDPGFYKVQLTLTGEILSSGTQIARFGGRRPGVPVDFWVIEADFENSSDDSPIYLTWPTQYFWISPSGGYMSADVIGNNLSLSVGWQKVANPDGTIINPINFL